MCPEDFCWTQEEEDGAISPGTPGLDDPPQVESIKRGGRSSKRSWSNLRGQVGRFLAARLELPWEETRRELLATFGALGVPPRMLDQRLPDLVELDVIEEDGELLRRDPRSFTLSPLAALVTQRPLLYVCPSTGLLRRFTPEDTRGRLRLSPWELVRQLGKRWYVLTLEPIPPHPPRTPTVDVVLRCVVDQPSPRLAARLERLYGRSDVFAREKRQVGKVELERLRAGIVRPCR
jgi:hypothetical protein